MDGWMIVTLPKTAKFAAKSFGLGSREMKARKLYHAPSLTRSVFTCVNLVFNVTPPMPVEASNKVSVVLRSLSILLQTPGWNLSRNLS